MKRIVEAILKFETGQNLAEYGLIVALFAVALIIVFGGFALATNGVDWIRTII